MNKKVFLDTNIVADVMNGARAHHKDAMRLLEKLVSDDYVVCISEDMISTLYYIAKDKTSALEFFKNVIFIDWDVLIFGKDILTEGIRMSLDNGVDLEDALQCLCAKNNGCNILITNDKKFFDCGIEILTVERFLAR